MNLSDGLFAVALALFFGSLGTLWTGVIWTIPPWAAGAALYGYIAAVVFTIASIATAEAKPHEPRG